MESEQRNKLEEILSRLAHLNLSGYITAKQDHPSGIGSTCDVFVALSQKHQKSVAVKRIRAFLLDDLAFANTLAREIRIWAALKHANILPLLGFITEGEKAMPSLISEWMSKGTMFNFMKTFPRASITTCKLLYGISEGLAYLHSEGIVHADLKSQNILISQDEEPLLSDFGLSLTLLHSTTVISRSSSSGKGTIRWMARELVVAGSNEPLPNHDERTDIWALGMVVYEMLTLKFPYWRIETDALVLDRISKGELPEEPLDLPGTTTSNGLWILCEECWTTNTLRPSAKQISDRLSNMIEHCVRINANVKIEEACADDIKWIDANVTFECAGEIEWAGEGDEEENAAVQEDGVHPGSQQEYREHQPSTSTSTPLHQTDYHFGSNTYRRDTEMADPRVLSSSNVYGRIDDPPSGRYGSRDDPMVSPAVSFDYSSRSFGSRHREEPESYSSSPIYNYTRPSCGSAKSFGTISSARNFDGSHGTSASGSFHASVVSLPSSSTSQYQIDRVTQRYPPPNTQDIVPHLHSTTIPLKLTVGNGLPPQYWSPTADTRAQFSSLSLQQSTSSSSTQSARADPRPFESGRSVNASDSRVESVISSPSMSSHSFFGRPYDVYQPQVTGIVSSASTASAQHTSSPSSPPRTVCNCEFPHNGNLIRCIICLRHFHQACCRIYVSNPTKWECWACIYPRYLQLSSRLNGGMSHG